MQRVQAVSALYEQNRFLDAWAVAKNIYQDKKAIAELDAESLVLLGRLAHRLGSGAAARLLFYRAKQRAPELPSVRYFARRDRHRGTLLEQITNAERGVEYFKDHAEFQSALQVELAFDYATVQDFENAKLWMSRALKLAPEDSFVRAYHSRVLQTIGDREGALAEAEAAWAISPGKPSAASAIASSLAALGRVEEAAVRLSGFVESTKQSYEVAQTAIGAAILAATRKGETAMRATARHALASMPLLEELAPLRDRSTRRLLAAIGLEAARRARELQTAKKYAHEINSPFYDRVLASIEANPNGARIMLPHKFSRQGIAECLPASLSTCLGAFGIELDHQRLAEKMTFGGTAMWRARAWADENNYLTRAFIADADISVKLIDAGVPFVLSIPGLDDAHACAVIGVDHATGTLLIHDPNHDGVAEMSIEMIGRTDAPFGPQALLVVPRSEAARVDGLQFPYAIEEDAWGELERLMAQRADQAPMLELLEKMRRAGGSAAHVELFEARLAAYRGETSPALERVDRLGRQFPKSISLEVFRLQLVRALGNTVRLREVLAKLVESDTFEEATDHPSWFRGHPSLRVEYAEVLASSAQHHQGADRQLDHALAAAPGLARAYELYGRLKLERGQVEAALLPLRIACTLQPSDDSAARHYVQALLAATREEEAIAWLQERIQRFAGNENAAPTWIALIDLFVLLGRDDRAYEQLCAARKELPESAAIAVCAVSVLAERGELSAARAALDELKRTRFYYSAAIALARIQRQDEAAKTLAEAWVAAEPGSLPARKTCLELVLAIDGPHAAARLAEGWLAAEDERREPFELLALEVLAHGGLRKRRIDILERRIARNPLDAWAHRELALQRLSDARSAAPAKRSAAIEALKSAIADCERSSPDHPLTLGLRGDLASLENDHERAYTAFRQAMELDAGAGRWMVLYADAAKKIGKSHELVIAAIDRALSTVPGFKKIFPSAVAAVGLIGSIRDARALTAKWRKKTPHDVEIAVADVMDRLAELTLEGDAGLEHEARELEKFAVRHPAHAGLHHALGALAVARRDFARAIEYFKRAIELSPEVDSIRLYLFELLLLRNEVDESEMEKELVSERDAYRWLNYLNDRNRYEEALAWTAKIAERYPSSVEAQERYLLQLEHEKQLFDGDQLVNSFFERNADRAEVLRFHARYLSFLKAGDYAPAQEKLLRRALDLDSPDLEAFSELYDLYDATDATEKRLALLDEFAPVFETPTPIVLRRAAHAMNSQKSDEARILIDAHLLRYPDDLAARNFWISAFTPGLDARTLLDYFDQFVVTSPAHARVAARLLSSAAAQGGLPERIERGWAKLRAPTLCSFQLELDYIQFLTRFERPAEALELARRLEGRSLDHYAELAAALILAKLRAGSFEEARASMKELWRAPRIDQQLIVEVLNELADSPYGLDPVLRDLRASIAAGTLVLRPIVESVARVIGERRLVQAGRTLAEAIIATGRRELWRGLLPSVIQAMSDGGAAMFVVELHRQHPQLAEIRALRTQHAQALLDVGHLPDAKKIVELWREEKYPSVNEAWLHSYCCDRLGDFEQTIASCRDALALRPLRIETGTLVQRLFGANIKLEQRPGKPEVGAKRFLEDWERYGHLLPPSLGGDDQLSPLIVLFVKLLKANTPEEVKVADGALLDFFAIHESEWAKPAYKKWVAPKLPWWKRWLRALGF